VITLKDITLRTLLSTYPVLGVFIILWLSSPRQDTVDNSDWLEPCAPNHQVFPTEVE